MTSLYGTQRLTNQIDGSLNMHLRWAALGNHGLTLLLSRGPVKEIKKRTYYSVNVADGKVRAYVSFDVLQVRKARSA